MCGKLKLVHFPPSFHAISRKPEQKEMFLEWDNNAGNCFIRVQSAVLTFCSLLVFFYLTFGEIRSEWIRYKDNSSSPILCSGSSHQYVQTNV